VVADVRGRVEELLAASPLGDRVSVAVRDARTGAELLAVDSTRSVPAASTAKLATAIAAIHELGPQHRFRSELRAPQAPDAGGVVHGDVVLVGGGDPALQVEDLAAMADRLRADGVRRITGSVTPDDSLLERTRWAETWPERMRLRDSRALGALLLGQHADGSPARADEIPRPDEHAAGVFDTLLRQRGIEIDGVQEPLSGSVSNPDVTLASHESPPLSEILGFMLQRSSSTTAELLARHLGLATTGAGTTEAGSRAIEAAWPAGAPGVAVADGSGLASGTRTSADALARLLVDAAGRPETRGVLEDAMSIAGVRGTIRKRMTDPATAGNVQAKTGTARDASNLAGWFDDPSGRRLAFGITTHPIRRDEVVAARALQDAIVGALATGTAPAAGAAAA
jgi:D-alanyl-D-alanine carboxypeptidase/D-alanyl-D-alanine-endopeptidase (penicillin-binding protein 4)